jgi:hypothetical protein
MEIVGLTFFQSFFDQGFQKGRVLFLQSGGIPDNGNCLPLRRRFHWGNSGWILGVTRMLSIEKVIFFSLTLFASTAIAADDAIVSSRVRDVAAPVFVEGQGWQWKNISGNSEALAKIVLSIPNDELANSGQSQCQTHRVREAFHDEDTIVLTGVGETTFLGKKLRLEKEAFNSGPSASVTRAEFEGGQKFVLWQETRSTGHSHARCNYETVKLKPEVAFPIAGNTDEACRAAMEKANLIPSNPTIQGPFKNEIHYGVRLGGRKVVDNSSKESGFVGFLQNAALIFSSTEYTYACALDKMTCDLSAPDSVINVFDGRCLETPALEYNRYCYLDDNKSVAELSGESVGLANYLALYRGDKIVEDIRNAVREANEVTQPLNRHVKAWFAHYSILHEGQVLDGRAYKLMEDYPTFYSDQNIADFKEITGGEAKPFYDYRAKKQRLDELETLSSDENKATSKLSEDLLKLNAISLCCNDKPCRDLVNASNSGRRL